MPQAMVVDDSRAMRLILSSTLAQLGYDVLQAGHGVEALSILERSGPVSLILVDWNMPVMNGLEFVKRLRSDPHGTSAVVMMVTTETAMHNMVEALEAGANEYVMKPFTKEVIADKLRLLHALQ